jgi:Zn-finger nucleic acid-binding protein
MRCPRCEHELDGRPAKCVQCHGCWVSVVDVARTVKSEAPAWTDEGKSQISCPECYATMQAITLHDVHLDRCAQHGVWFDIDEITDMLRKSGKIGPGESASADKPSVASKVGGGAAAVGDVIVDVVAAVLDIVS